MFIEFQVGNFRSFRDIQKFTMQASPKRPNDHGLDENNVFEDDGFRLLRTKAIYGSNASGKSNFIKAMAMFSWMVYRSVSDEEITRSIWKDRFQLITDWEDQPIFFQYTFSKNGEIYRYGFEILKDRVNSEWFFQGEANTEKKLFFRNQLDLQFGPEFFHNDQKSGNELISRNSELFRSDSLYITASALANNRLASHVRNEILNIRVINGLYDDNFDNLYAYMVLNSKLEEEIKALKQWMKAADTGIEDIILKNNEEHGNNVGKFLYSLHSVFDEEGKWVRQIPVPFEDWESSGTDKLLKLGAVVLDTLRHGKILALDELDAKLHPNLTLKIVSMFNYASTNPKNAQLIFVSHDTGLLRRADLRRDQISLVNKDRYGISDLTTLIEFKGVRKDSSYEKEYLNGSYSAVPFVDELDDILMQKNSK